MNIEHGKSLPFNLEILAEEVRSTIDEDDGVEMEERASLMMNVMQGAGVKFQKA